MSRCIRPPLSLRCWLTRYFICRAEVGNSTLRPGTELQNGNAEHQAGLGSQTQQETQLTCPAPLDVLEDRAAGEPKRKNSKTPNQLQTRPSKKVKISLGPAVDLGD